MIGGGAVRYQAPEFEARSLMFQCLHPQNCMYDTCNCEKSEDCMCAALSSYVFACAAKGVLLSGWRDKVCCEYAVGYHRFYIPTLATNGILPLSNWGARRTPGRTSY